MKVEEIKLAFETNIQLQDVNTLKADNERMKKGIQVLSGLRIEMKKQYLNHIDKVDTNRGLYWRKAIDLGFKPADIENVPEYKASMDLQRKLDDAFYQANKF